MHPERYPVEFLVEAAGEVILSAKNPQHAVELLKKMLPPDLIRESSQGEVAAGEVVEMTYGDLV
jgi:hypothetical protein